MQNKHYTYFNKDGSWSHWNTDGIDDPDKIIVPGQYDRNHMFIDGNVVETEQPAAPIARPLEDRIRTLEKQVAQLLQLIGGNNGNTELS